jgi:hypothetical protein
MNRFSLALVAATTTAIAATGVMALSAVGDDQRPTAADRIKKHQAADEPGVAPAELLACLRARGLDPPTRPDELKMWILRTPAAKPCIDVPKQEAGADCGAGKPKVPATRSD